MSSPSAHQRLDTGAHWSDFGRRLWACVLLLNLLVAAALGYALFVARQHHLESARTETGNLAMLLEREIAGTFENIDLALKTVADDHAGKPIPSTEFDRDLQRVRNYFPTLSRLRGVDAAGRFVAGRQPSDPPGASVADRDYFIAHRDQTASGLIISKPVFGRVSRQWSLILSRRLEGPDGRFSGIVAASLPLTFWQQRFASLRLGTNGSVGLRDSQLHLILRYPELAGGTSQIGTTKIATDFTEALARNPGQGSYRAGATSIDGVIRHHSYRKNDTYGFYINVGVSEEEHLAVWRSELRRSVIWFSVFLLASVLMALYVQGAWRRKEQVLSALAESEARFRVMFEQAGVGVAWIDSNTGCFLKANQKYADVVGFSVAELESSTFQAVTHPEDLAADLNNMALLRSGRIDHFSMEKRYVRKDGSIVWVQLTVTPLWNPGAPPTTHIAIVSDITQRKLLEARRG